MFNWKERYADKLRAPEEAVRVVESGQKVAFSQLATPETLCRALSDRWEELENVQVDLTGSLASLYGFLQPGREAAFKLRSQFALNPLDMAALTERNLNIEFCREDIALSRARQDEKESLAWLTPDVFMCCCSPPNEQGYCSFGNHLWFSKSQARRAEVVIAEVDPDYIRTGGDNFVHVQEIDILVDKQVPNEQTRGVVGQGQTVNEYEDECAHVVGSLVTSLMKDGDCFEIGGGNLAMRTTAYMDRFVDLGVHTEAIHPGVVSLMRNGIVTGKRKTLHPGKAVGTAVIPESGDYWYCDGNPAIELYECTYTNNPKVIAQNDNMIAIQPCLAVDLLGQIAVENIGTRYLRGTGGSFNFAMGALLSRGGRSVYVVPSTTPDRSRTHIVPQLPSGTITSIPASLADYVITEHGIATLMGKSERERAEELIAIAHPDFRTDLRNEMKKMLYA